LGELACSGGYGMEKGTGVLRRIWAASCIQKKGNGGNKKKRGNMHQVIHT